ncbi:MAG: GTPase HflX [Saprospiraceae bacterium]|nr:GTPase HflX [Saprospiraceae bacterium]MBK6565543.1 GTPase HflX [Saprospiraceae bacterium]MBK7523057.1 GTPase HflX [Saprospiraceae bacterium]MBK8370567.1 GTPase HflX [Saprospiraceae bacterium]MBK8546514.1 GTPase HflX [Saprospiraceae bacterium]
MSENWKVGKEEKKGIRKEIEHCILIAVIDEKHTENQVLEYLEELRFLAETAGAVADKLFTQKLDHPNVKTYVGSGKLDEIKDYIESHEEISLAIFDDDLTGKQTSFLEEYLKVKIVDRSSLILDIFAERAQTAQAKSQVELAQMQYLLPRLRGLWTHLERQRGGIGMRGPGEMEIETDRRIVRDKIAMLKKKLEKIDQQSQTQRKNRGELIRVALVGYTNVGKSTLMNVLSKSEVFAENKLFATLDTTVRKVVWESTPFLLSDTVGFIRKLPHHLVESFKSTLDEVRESDILVHVVDLSHPQHEDQIHTVQNTLKDMEAADKTTLMVLNKLDRYRELNFDSYLEKDVKEEIEVGIKENYQNQFGHEVLLLSAQTKENLDDLREILYKMILEEYEKRFPFQTQSW